MILLALPAIFKIVVDNIVIDDIITEMINTNKNKIQRLTASIRNFEDAELSLGTLKTLKMIDDESEILVNKIKELEVKK